jgi:hypothetical protein
MEARRAFVDFSSLDFEIVDYALYVVLEAVDRVDNDEESALERSAIRQLKNRLSIAYEKLLP